MDFWKSPQKQKGWDYIKTIDPDICLLNECSNPNLFINYIHNEQTNGWGCGVFSKHKLDEIIIDKCHPGAIAICETNINSINITAISLYGQIIDGFAITTLHRSLSDLTPIFQKKSLRDCLLIGGDFNADTELDKRQGGKSHSIFFERLRDFKLYDCCKKFNTERVRTLRHKNSVVEWQNDYLFAGKKIYDKCISCKVIDDESLYDISDHNPILAEFSL